MLAINATNARMWSMLGQRGSFGVAMLDAFAQAPNVMVLTADLGTTAGLDRFRSTHPDRFLNVGIAEQNMVGIAAGLAKEGFNVFATTFATFATMRAYEPTRVHLGYMKRNIKLIGLGSGLAMGQYGNTHYGIEDIALMRAVPGLTIISPADGAEVVKTVACLVNHDGPVYVRLTGTMNNPIVYREEYDFRIGKAVWLREGADCTLVATGTMVHESMAAAKALAEQGISAAVLNMHTIRPLDEEALDRAVKTTRRLVTVEEHSIVGGLGGAVSEHLARLGNARLLTLGLPHAFGNIGEYKYLLRKYGLHGADIAARVAAFVRGEPS
jgi:transketolase